MTQVTVTQTIILAKNYKGDCNPNNLYFTLGVFLCIKLLVCAYLVILEVYKFTFMNLWYVQYIQRGNNTIRIISGFQFWISDVNFNYKYMASNSLKVNRYYRIATTILLIYVLFVTKHYFHQLYNCRRTWCIIICNSKRIGLLL